MSNVYFISDLHVAHKKVMEFTPEYRHGDTWLENVHSIVCRWNTRVRKRDTVYVLGDVCMDKEYLEILGELQGTKYLVRGNHDMWNAKDYLQYFNDIFGIRTYKGFWISHAPIHPAELRGRKNIHGHVHQQSIRNAYGELDKRYINVSIETTDGAPVLFTDIRDGFHTGEPIRKT